MKRLFYRILNPFRTAYRFIFRPKTTGVKCLVEHNGKFLMIRIAYGHKHWTFPGGGVDRGELPEIAAKREVREEVGIEVEKVTPIGEYFNTRHYSKDTVYCFYSKVASDYFSIDNNEVAEARWFSLSEIPAMQSFAVREVLNLYAKRSI
ncbi:MAG: hypothetical protein A3D92_22165 [Bacteroidetes bacterium RIFCSPHIGHO2_02_FULL_44_7]|nr:MAG: hypothetical protein A3D92_22165 [Bacteroidetes bacterium RIFCSPHIGHO2_02_FULL_44_7]